MSNYTPAFPRSISGGKYRLPLDHHHAEAVAARFDRIYREINVSAVERGVLLREYQRLQQIDHWFMVAERAGGGRYPPESLPGRPLPPPKNPTSWLKAFNMSHAYLSRIAIYLSQLERKYGLDKEDGYVPLDDI